MSPRPLSLELNPSARISIVDHAPSPAFLVEAPIKGASFSSIKVCVDNLPDAHAFLCSILIDGQKDAQIDAQTAAELGQIDFRGAILQRLIDCHPDPMRMSREIGSRCACPTSGRSRHSDLNRITTAAYGHLSNSPMALSQMAVTTKGPQKPRQRKRCSIKRRPALNLNAKVLACSRTCFQPSTSRNWVGIFMRWQLKVFCPPVPTVDPCVSSRTIIPLRISGTIS